MQTDRSDTIHVSFEPWWRRLHRWFKSIFRRRFAFRRIDIGAQRISFAYGNTALHNPEITREDVERAAVMLRPQFEQIQRVTEEEARRMLTGDRDE